MASQTLVGIELWLGETLGELHVGHLLSLYVTHALHIARISNVKIIMSLCIMIK